MSNKEAMEQALKDCIIRPTPPDILVKQSMDAKEFRRQAGAATHRPCWTVGGTR